jgi:hypothetical protein
VKLKFELFDVERRRGYVTLRAGGQVHAIQQAFDHVVVMHEEVD